MQHSPLPGTTVSVSKLCLGTMMFGGQTSQTDAMSIMDSALDGGINFFDTANTYNDGESERIVGKWLKGGRNRVLLATKVGVAMKTGTAYNRLTAGSITASCEESLRRLDTDYIDIFYLHAPDYLTPLEESLGALDGLIRAGKVRWAAVSNHAAWQIADMAAICEKNNMSQPVVSQNPYNLITRSVEPELIPCLLAHTMGLVVYNPIAGGLLAGKHKPGQPADNTRFANDKRYFDRYWSEENFAAVEKLTALAREHNMSILELSMRWVVQQKGVTSVITGVSRLEQMVQNLKSIKEPDLSPAVLTACDEVWNNLAGTRFSYHR